MWSFSHQCSGNESAYAIQLFGKKYLLPYEDLNHMKGPL